MSAVAIFDTDMKMGEFVSRNRIVKIGEGIYLLYFALMIGARALGLYEGMLEYNITLGLGLGLILCKMILPLYTIKEYAIIVFLMIVAGMVYIHTGEKGLIVCFATLVGMKGVSVSKTIEIGALVAGVIILSKVFIGVFGVASEIYYPQDRAGVGMMFRHSLGYAHPNTMHMNVLMLSMMLVYLVTTLIKEKNRNAMMVLFSFSLLVLLFNVYIFLYSGSRTGLLACFVYLTINLWLFVRKNVSLFEKIILFAAFPVVCFVAIIMPLIVDDKLFELLNAVFHSRFSIAKYFWNNNSISLWGIRLTNPDPGLERYGLDMAQLYLFLQLGLVAFFVIAILTIWFIYECIKHDKRAELSVMMGMLFVGMWEPFLYNLGFKNFVYVFMGAMLFGVLDNNLSLFDSYNGFIKSNIIDAICCNDRRYRKSSLRIISFSLLIGAFTALLYLAITPEPSALYGDREENEAGFSFGMPALYLDVEQVKMLEDSGDIVIGYVDETVPMYKYDESIAHMEYEKKILSVGLWTSALLVVVLLISRRFCSQIRGH